MIFKILTDIISEKLASYTPDIVIFGLLLWWSIRYILQKSKSNKEIVSYKFLTGNTTPIEPIDKEIIQLFYFERYSQDLNQVNERNKQFIRDVVVKYKKNHLKLKLKLIDIDMPYSHPYVRYYNVKSIPSLIIAKQGMDIILYEGTEISEDNIADAIDFVRDKKLPDDQSNHSGPFD